MTEPSRIYQLEQALDQALSSLAELQAQVHDHQLLETQLAATEEFASVQQQAIARLKYQLTQHQQTQALLQQRCQELETDCDRHQSRVLELEQQIAEMQEQILKQARQATEYEAALQNWKDRCRTSQQHLLQLEQYLEQSLTAKLALMPDRALTELGAEIKLLLSEIRGVLQSPMSASLLSQTGDPNLPTVGLGKRFKGD